MRAIWWGMMGVVAWWLSAGVPSSACAQSIDLKKPDWTANDAPANPAEIITVPEFPQANRRFTIKWSGRNSGSGDVLRVANDRGRLDIMNGQKVVATINLGRCFAISQIDDNHNWGKYGNPQYATTPPDCRAWDGRRWFQTYRTQLVQLRNPCYYQPTFTASVKGSPGARILETYGSGVGMFTDRQQTFNLRTTVVFDESLGFFRMFNVGYVGQVDVLNEIR